MPGHWFPELHEDVGPETFDEHPQDPDRRRCPADSDCRASRRTGCRHADEATKLARTDIGHEAVACSMYYNFIAQLGKRDWPQEDNSPAERPAEFTMGIGLLFLPHDVATALQKLTASEISQMLAGDTGRLPILAAKHADLCKALIERPKTRSFGSGSATAPGLRWTVANASIGLDRGARRS
jgi:hypothetical protein